MTYPAVPLGDQWSGAAFLDETAMYNRVDVPINAIAHELATWGHDFASFRGYLAANTAITAGANIPYTVDTDNKSGWNATTKAYTVPNAGLYVVTAQLKTTAAVGQNMSITGLPAAQYPRTPKVAQIPAIGASGKCMAATVRLAGGEVIAVIQGATATSQGETTIGTLPVYNVEQTWLRISQIGH